MSKPIWLLDVAGVLNAFDETRPVLGEELLHRDLIKLRP